MNNVYFVTFLFIIILSYINYTIFYIYANYTNKIGYGNVSLIIQFIICCIISIPYYLKKGKWYIYPILCFVSLAIGGLLWMFSEMSFLHYILDYVYIIISQISPTKPVT